MSWVRMTMNNPDKEIRVLIIGPTEPLGGLEKCVALQASLDLGERFKLFHLDTKYHPIVRKAKLLKLIHIFSYLLPTMRRIIRDESIDIVHIHTTSYKNVFKNIELQEAAKKLGVKSIIHAHGGYFDRYYENLSSVWKKRLERGLNRADVLICLSEGWKEFFSKTFQKTKTIVLENAVDLEPFKKIAQSRTYHQVDEMKVLYLGRVSLMKGIFELIEVAKKLRESVTRVKFIIVGRSERGEISKLRWALQDADLSDRFDFKGEIRGFERDELLSLADCFILPSRAEGMPITIIEAFACGLPVIATKVGAIPEMIRNGENGLLVEAEDTSAMSDALIRFANDHSLRERIGRAGCENAEKRFSVNNWVDELRRIYSEVYAGTG